MCLPKKKKREKKSNYFSCMKLMEIYIIQFMIPFSCFRETHRKGVYYIISWLDLTSLYRGSCAYAVIMTRIVKSWTPADVIS